MQLFLFIFFLFFVFCYGDNDAAGENALGLSYAESSDYERALSHFKKAHQQALVDGVTPGSLVSDYANNIGVSLMRLNRLREAKHVFTKALAVQPTHADCRENLGVVNSLLSRSEDFFDGAAAADNDNSDAGSDAGSDAEQKKKKRNKKKFKKNEAVDEEDEDQETNNKRERKRRSKKTKSSKPAPNNPTTAVKQKPKRFGSHLDRVRRENVNVRPPLPRIHIKHLYLNENTEYALGRAPFILVGAMDDWKLKQKWNWNALAERFKNVVVDFYPHNMARADAHPFLAPLSEAMSEFSVPSGKYPNSETHPGTYIQWNIDDVDWHNLTSLISPAELPYYFRRDEEWIDDCLTTKSGESEGVSESEEEKKKRRALVSMFTLRTHWRMLLIGTRGAGMFNHHDVLRTSSWQSQISGSKRWHICPPSESGYLYKAGNVDAFDPDYAAFPLFRQAKCVEDTVNEGEMIFYPMDYWHQTENINTPTISLSASVLDENNYRFIRDELVAECTEQKYKWGFSIELCQQLHKCYAWWDQRYGQRPKQETCKLTDK